METPSKRRKISPTASIKVNALNTQPSSTGPDIAQASSRRASFLSPTKASLARFNPNLLPRSKSTGPQRPSSGGSKSPARQPRARSSTPNRVNGIDHNDLSFVQGNGPNKTLFRRDGSGGESIVASPQRLRTPRTEDTPSELPRASFTPSAQASPSQGLLKALGGRRLSAGSAPTRNRGTNSIGWSSPSAPNRTKIIEEVPEHTEDGEPRLPSTPTQLGLEAPPEKPKGLFFSSPGERSKRSDKSLTKSSPLRPANSVPEIARQNYDRTVSKLGLKKYIDGLPGPLPSAQRAELLRKDDDLRRLDRQLQNIQDELTRDLLLSKCGKNDPTSNKRIKRRRKEVREKAKKYLNLHEDSQSRPTSTSPPDFSPTSNSLTRALALFLPFSSRPLPTKPPPKLLSSTSDPTSTPQPLIIHTTKPRLLPTTDPPSLHLSQEITLTTPFHPKLATLSLTIDLPTQTLIKTALLDLAPWARELQPWLSAPQTHEIATLGKTIARYIELSTLRDECWQELHSSFPTLRPPDEISNTRPGRQTLTFTRSSTSVNLNWRIRVEGKGQGEEEDELRVVSDVSAEAVVPERWREIDEGGELGKVGVVFGRLVVECGVLGAGRVIVGVVFEGVVG